MKSDNVAQKIRHRIVRVWQSYFPKPLTQYEHIRVKRYLDKNGLTSLFYSQPLCDQRHGFLVYDRCTKLFEEIEDSPTDEELFITSTLHDVSKKDSCFSVTQRVAAATIVSFIPLPKLRTIFGPNSKITKRVELYADHSSLSWKYISETYQSDFVREATLLHHETDEVIDESKQANNVRIFIEADTL